MFKRCRFIVALMVCAYVFAFGVVGTACADTSFYGSALELSGQLGLYFYLQEAVPGTMTFTINGKTQTLSFNGSDTGNVDGLHKYEKGGITYWGFRCDTTSIQMADTITATFTPTNGTAITNNTTIDSVEDYLTQLDTTSKTNLSALVNAIKDYGYYAHQTLKDTNSNYGDYHADMQHTPTATNTEDISWTNTVPAPNSPALSTYAISVKDSSNKDVDGVSFALDLDSNTALHICLPSSIYPSTATASATVQKVTETTNGTITRSAYANAVDATMTTDTETISGAEYTVLSISDIPAHEIDNKYTITITNGGSTTHTIEISPLSYVYSVISKSDEQLNADAKLGDSGTYTKAQNLKKAVIAFYNYYAKTIAYRTSTEYNAQ